MCMVFHTIFIKLVGTSQPTMLLGNMGSISTDGVKIKVKEFFHNVLFSYTCKANAVI